MCMLYTNMYTVYTSLSIYVHILHNNIYLYTEIYITYYYIFSRAKTNYHAYVPDVPGHPGLDTLSSNLGRPFTQHLTQNLEDRKHLGYIVIGAVFLHAQKTQSKRMSVLRGMAPKVNCLHGANRP